MRQLFAIICLLILGCAVAFADNMHKASPQLAAFLENRRAAVADGAAQTGQSAQSKAFAKTETVEVLVRFSNAAPLAQWLESRGLKARAMFGHSLTATLPVDSVEPLMALPEVESVTAKNKRKVFLDKVLSETHADAVHAGEGLLSPYTGKGVIVGVIDQGFDFTHPAFRNADGSSRILAALRSEPGKTHTPLTTSEQILAAKSDSLADATHGTHVLGIAAGGAHACDNAQCGIAPDADIVLVSSENFEDPEIVDGINYISSVAKQYGEPFVVNMSFGTSDTPHHGKHALGQALDELSNEGALLVASVGNYGNRNAHARLTFSPDNDTRYLYLKNRADSMIVSFYSQNSETFHVTVGIYNKQTKVLEAKNIIWLLMNKCLSRSGVEEITNRYYVRLELNGKSLFANYPGDEYCVAFAVKAEDGNVVDAWVSDDDCEFGDALDEDERFDCDVDGDYFIASPADAESVVSVAAHTLRDQYVDIYGVPHAFSLISVGEHAYYSSKGPLVGEAVVKPTVSAPGTLVLSSIFDNNGAYTNSSSKKKYIKSMVTYGGQDYYYGYDSGTSMSSPVVTGAVALWLEACPDLTAAQLQEIIRNSAVKDAFTRNVPNKLWGYGKLDIYAGLKEALLISGIPSARNTEEPFTLQAYGDHWQVLLNTDEDFADARLVGLDGTELWRHRIENPTRGTDFAVPTAQFPKGIYLLQLRSANRTLTQKIVTR